VDLQTDNGNVLWSLIQGEQLEFPVILNFITVIPSTFVSEVSTPTYTLKGMIIEADNNLSDSGVPVIAKVGGKHYSCAIRVPPYKYEWTNNVATTGGNTVTTTATVTFAARNNPIPVGTLINVSGVAAAAATPTTCYNVASASVTASTTTSVSYTITAPSGTTAITTQGVVSSLYKKEDVVLYSSVYYKLASGSGYLNSTTPNLNPLWEVYANPNTVYVQIAGNVTTGGTDTLNSTWTAWTVQPQVNNSIYGFFELSVQEPAGGTYQRTWKPVRGLIEFNYSPTALF
jgi:hypothetical protein